jgi:hypothetical protein
MPHKLSKGILYCSAKGYSGYAIAAKLAIYELIYQDNIPISWHRFSVDDTDDDKSDLLYNDIRHTINQHIEYDTVIFHCTPPFWNDHLNKYKIKYKGKKLIGYTVWETDKLPSTWSTHCNNLDEIWVPTYWNKIILKKSNVTVPIEIKPPKFYKKYVLPKVTESSIGDFLNTSKALIINSTKDKFKYDSSWTVFYNISELSVRKGVHDTIKCFCETFDNTYKVKLILKIHKKDYSDSNVNLCKQRVLDLLSNYKSHPEIVLITSLLSESNIRFLHSIGDCYISLCKSEGWGLPIFDAYNYKNDIIVTKYGGHLEYLKKDHKWYINTKLSNVIDIDSSDLYSNDQHWGIPEISHAKKVIKSYATEKNIKKVDYITKKSEAFKVININITPNEENPKGIVYFGQYGICGYAIAAKRYLYDFYTRNIPISWKPLYFEKDPVLSNDCPYNLIIKSLINKNIKEYDTIIFHSTPDIWPQLISQHSKLIKNKNVVGYTVWESSKLPEQWVKYINESVNEVWCPSTHNQTVFKKSGVIIPIKVVPHIFLKQELPDKDSIEIQTVDGNAIIKNIGIYTFYNISELSDRKGIDDLIKTFCETFTKKDKVRLILKIHYKDYTTDNKQYCLKHITSIVNSYKNTPPIYLLLDNLCERGILSLHSIGDCYISLCKSEGFGLTIFDAYHYGKKIIVTGYGGHIDFLGKNYDGLVKYKLEKVNSNMTSFSSNYSQDQEWAYPDLNHAKELMRGAII